MGITGLLPLLSSITRSTNLSEYAGLRVAVDAYVWLHRGAYGCSFELCQGIGTHKYLSYCMKMVNLLRSYKIIPVLVFDGGNLPSKKDTEVERHSKRKEAKEKGIEAMQHGDKKSAYEYFQRAVDVTPRMAFNLIELLKKEGVEFIVAPYEADAQLAFLSMNGLVDAVISEDSDLIPYGCHRMIYKLDKDGNGKSISLKDIGSVTEIDLSNFSLEKLRHMCIISGCDYLESIPGMGLKKAHALIMKHGNMAEVFKALEKSKSHQMPPDYRENFARADLTFQHQIVYDPRLGKAVHLNALPEEIDASTMDFVGKILEDHIAQNIACGRLDPHSHQPFILTTSSDIFPHISQRNSLNQSQSQQNQSQQRLSTPPTNSQWMSTRSTISVPNSQSHTQPHIQSQSQQISYYHSMSQVEMAKHDDDMTRDIRKYSLQRGSRSSVSKASSSASNLISSLNSKGSPTLLSYFKKQEPSESPSAATRPLFRSSIGSPPNNNTNNHSNTSSPNSTPSKITHKQPEVIIRSKYFSPQKTETISPPSSLERENSSPSMFDQYEDMDLGADIEEMLATGRRVQKNEEDNKSSKTQSNSFEADPLLLPPTHVIQKTSSSIIINSSEESTASTVTADSPASTRLSLAPKPMRLSIPLVKLSIYDLDDEDEDSNPPVAISAKSRTTTTTLERRSSWTESIEIPRFNEIKADITSDDRKKLVMMSSETKLQVNSESISVNAGKESQEQNSNESLVSSQSLFDAILEDKQKNVQKETVSEAFISVTSSSSVSNGTIRGETTVIEIEESTNFSTPTKSKLSAKIDLSQYILKSSSDSSKKSWQSSSRVALGASPSSTSKSLSSPTKVAGMICRSPSVSPVKNSKKRKLDDISADCTITDLSPPVKMRALIPDSDDECEIVDFIEN